MSYRELTILQKMYEEMSEESHEAVDFDILFFVIKGAITSRNLKFLITCSEGVNDIETALAMLPKGEGFLIPTDFCEQDLFEMLEGAKMFVVHQDGLINPPFEGVW